jgi:hypothetical protein
MSGSLAPYFEPVFPACIYQCQLCGVQVSQDDALSLDHVERSRRGLHLFCKGCAPHLNQIGLRLSAEVAAMDAAYEKSRAGKIKELAQALMDEVKEMAGVASPSPSAVAPVAPPSAPPTRRPRPLSIPRPE